MSASSPLQQPPDGFNLTNATPKTVPELGANAAQALEAPSDRRSAEIVALKTAWTKAQATGKKEAKKSELMGKATLFKDVGDFLSLPYDKSNSLVLRLNMSDKQLGNIKKGLSDAQWKLVKSLYGRMFDADWDHWDAVNKIKFEAVGLRPVREEQKHLNDLGMLLPLDAAEASEVLEKLASAAEKKDEAEHTLSSETNGETKTREMAKSQGDIEAAEHM